MARVFDGISLLFWAAACGAFVFAMRAVVRKDDLVAALALAGGACALKLARDVLPARSG